MKHLFVEHLKGCGSDAGIGAVSFALDSVEKNILNQVPWTEYNYRPSVHFALAYTTGNIFLKYYVNEKYIRAANSAYNSAVCEDTCVEFFVSFDNEPTYYNFEFNCIGTMLAGYGKNKKARNLLSATQISEVKYQAVINNNVTPDNMYWELTVAIPLTVFCHHRLNSLEGKQCRANFYKCGDNLPIPHYVTWSNIISPKPDFHLHEFFGTLHFV